MNEDQKNIETCLPENILAEVANVPTDAQFRSLVNESLDPLKQQAFQQAGSDAYKEVVDQHKPYTFVSSVKQMKSNLILLLRRLWRFPFGSGASLSDADTTPSLSDAGSLRSLADMWQHYITRLQGSETYGIPSRLSQLTDLPSAPLLVADRKITVGDMPVADGASMQCIFLTDMANNITDVKDYMQGYTLTKDNHTRRIWFLLFPNMTRLEIGCKKIDGGWALSASTKYGDDCPATLVFPYLEEVDGGGIYYGSTSGSHSDTVFSRLTTLQFPRLKKCNGYLFCGGWGNGGNALTSAQFPALEEVSGGVLMGGWYSGSCNNLTELEFPELTTISGGIVVNATGGYGAGFTKLESLRAPKLTKAVGKLLAQDSTYSESPNGFRKLILVEIGNGFASNLNLAGWYPRDVLADQDLLQQFLQNFREFIADKLQGGYPIGQGPILTLSKAVRNAIHAAESTYGIENIIITQKGWTISPAPN